VSGGGGGGSGIVAVDSRQWGPLPPPPPSLAPSPRHGSRAWQLYCHTRFNSHDADWSWAASQLGWFPVWIFDDTRHEEQNKQVSDVSVNEARHAHSVIHKSVSLWHVWHVLLVERFVLAILKVSIIIIIIIIFLLLLLLKQQITRTKLPVIHNDESHVNNFLWQTESKAFWKLQWIFLREIHVVGQRLNPVVYNIVEFQLKWRVPSLCRTQKLRQLDDNILDLTQYQIYIPVL